MDDGITIPLPRRSATMRITHRAAPAPSRDARAWAAAWGDPREAAALCDAASPVTKIRTEARRSIMGRVWSWLST